MQNLYSRHLALKFLDCILANGSVRQDQVLQIGELNETDQPRIGDGSFSQMQKLQSLDFSNMQNGRIADSSDVVQIKSFQFHANQ